MSFDRKTAVDAAVAWWRDLQPERDGHRNPRGDRAALARLRRCATVAEAMQEPATLDLFRRARASHADDLCVIALMAAVLVHVREDAGRQMSVARQLGPPPGGEHGDALMSPLRFQRLLAAESWDERLAGFRRMAALAGRRVNLRDLAESLFDWVDERRADQRRRRWIFEYWGAGNPVPTAETANPEPHEAIR